MTIQLKTEQVWQAIEKEPIAIIGMVTARQEAQTVGVVYVARDRKFYIGWCSSVSQPSGNGEQNLTDREQKCLECGYRSKFDG